jgi:hypothetical protein
MMNRAAQVVFSMGSFFLVFCGGHVHAKTDAVCAKAKVLSSSESCKSIKVAFDFSACGEKSNPGDSAVSISCSGSRATAKIELENESYSARLRKREGWGEASWDIVGTVTMETTISKPTTGQAVANSDKPASDDRKPNGTEQEPSAAQNAPPSVPQQNAITFSGLFDVYYSYNANTPSAPASVSANILNGNNNLRYYDIYHNQFALNLAELTVKKTGAEVSFLADLDFGSFADQNAAATSPSVGPKSQIVDEVSKHVGQAFVTYTPSWAPGLVLDVGKMATHVGYEVMKSRDNWQYSRASAFGFGVPFWHTGVHVGYAVVPNKFIPSVYVYNGWNSIYDTNSSKTLGAQLKFVPQENLTIIYNFIGGPEQASNNANRKTVHEANITYAATSSLSFALELLSGNEENVTIESKTVSPTWKAMTIHSKLQLMPRYFISPRFEVYSDSHGYTVNGTAKETLHGFTLTNGLVLAQDLEARVEFRYDHSTHGQRFIKRDGFSNHQFTSAVALMYTL